MSEESIRPIAKKDNAAIATVIRNVLVEFGVPKVGTAYADANLDGLYETYQDDKKVYFVLEIDGTICGGAGIQQLQGTTENICELQKMYFAPEVRGKGFGKMMITRCLQQAKVFGFAQCYLETTPYMHDARKLYEKSGFYYIDKPIGNTGHYSCHTWMLKDL